MFVLTLNKSVCRTKIARTGFMLLLSATMLTNLAYAYSLPVSKEKDLTKITNGNTALSGRSPHLTGKAYKSRYKSYPFNKNDKPQIIGHRGGVIDSTYTENSLGGLEAAYKRGYYMAEIDVRLTKDGQLIILHDASLNNYYHLNKTTQQLNWDEIRTLKSDRDGSSPILFEDALKYCQGHLQVMLDTKIMGNDLVNFKKMEDLLRKYNLLDNALFIGSNEIRNYFNGKSKTGYSINALKQLKSQNQFDPARYFLFSHGNEITEEDVKWAQENKIMVVPSINKYHYRDIPFMKGGKRDIDNLKKWGVVYYQIDSEFDQWLK